jgi:hypothetical protein
MATERGGPRDGGEGREKRENGLKGEPERARGEEIKEGREGAE